jgi:hypothetical protein
LQSIGVLTVFVLSWFDVSNCHEFDCGVTKTQVKIPKDKYKIQQKVVIKYFRLFLWNFKVEVFKLSFTEPLELHNCF